MGSRAIQVDSLWNGIFYNGSPVAGGQVYSYDAGTTNLKSLYAGADKSSALANPCTLDSNGRIQAYADGLYKFIIKDSLLSTLYTLDNLIYQFPDGSGFWASSVSLISNALTITLSPAISGTIPSGMKISFQVSSNSSGPVTVTVNGVGPYSLVDQDGYPLVYNSLAPGVQYEMTFFSGGATQWYLTAPSRKARGTSQAAAGTTQGTATQDLS